MAKGIANIIAAAKMINEATRTTADIVLNR